MMKCRIGFAGVFLLLGAIALCAQQPAKKSVMINKFEFNGEPELGSYFQNLETMLRTELIKSKKFTMLDRNQLGKQVEELTFGTSGLADQSKAKEFGKMVSADYLVYGTVVEARKTGRARTISQEYSFAVDLTIMDIETGSAMLAEQVKVMDYAASPQDAMRSLSVRLVNKVMFTLSPVTIASAKSGNIMLNYGSGFVEVGQVFDVYCHGEPVRDPATGEVIAWEEEKAGQIRVASVEAAFSRATEISASRPLAPNMVCRPADAAATVAAGAQPSAPAATLHAGKPRVVIGKFKYSSEFDLQQNADRSSSVAVKKASDQNSSMAALAGAIVTHESRDRQLGKATSGALGGADAKDQASRRSSTKKPQATASEQDATAMTKESQVLREMVINRFAKIGQFEVVERTRLDELEGEMGLAADGKFDAQTVAQEGKLSGADYVIMGTITRFSTDHDNTGLGFIGGRNKSLLKLAVELRLVEAASGKICLADSVEGAMASEKSSFTFLGFGSASDESGELGALFDSTSAAIVAKIITTLRPITVVDVNQDEITLNYGDGVVAVGEHFAILEKGQDIRDPYTGQVIGTREKNMATLQIVDVQPRYSKARIVSREKGIEFQDLKPGMICRPQEAPVARAAHEPVSAPEPAAPATTAPAPGAPSGPASKPTFTF